MAPNFTQNDIIFYKECLIMIDAYNKGGAVPELSQEQQTRFDRIAGELMNEKIRTFFKK